MKVFIKNNVKWLIASLSLFIFLSFIYNLLADKLVPFDMQIYSFVKNIQSPWLTTFFKIITSFASFPVLIIILFFMFIFIKKKKQLFFILINLINVICSNIILKTLIGRTRPEEWMLIEESGFSFPSGHASVATAFYGFIIYMLWHTSFSNNKKWCLTIILSTLIIFISFSRIYLGVHYASDVIAGISLSVFYLIIFTNIVSKHFDERRKKDV